MIDYNDILVWINNKLSVFFISETWVFGSVLCKEKIPNDVDIFVEYLDEYSNQIPNWKREIQKDFFDSFKLPLHLLTLSQSECIEKKIFLYALINKGKRIR